jgi:hypothetical protein
MLALNESLPILQVFDLLIQLAEDEEKGTAKSESLDSSEDSAASSQATKVTQRINHTTPGQSKQERRMQ